MSDGLQSTLQDPKFQALSPDDQVEVLKQMKAAGKFGDVASAPPAAPESFWQKLTNKGAGMSPADAAKLRMEINKPIVSPSWKELGEFGGTLVGGEVAGALKVGGLLEALIQGGGTALGSAGGQKVETGRVDWVEAAKSGALTAGMNALFRIGGLKAVKAGFQFLRGRFPEAFRTLIGSPEGEELAKQAGLGPLRGPMSKVSESPVPGGYKGPPKPPKPSAPEVTDVRKSPVPGGYKGPEDLTRQGKAVPISQSPNKPVPPPEPEVGDVRVAPGGYRGPSSVPKPTPPPKEPPIESGDILKGPTALQHKAVRAGQAKVAGLAERKVVPIGETPEPQPEPPEAEEGPEGTTPSPVTPSSAEKPAASAGGATVPKPLRSAPATTPAAQAKKYGLELREPSVKGSKMTSFGDSITGGSIEMPEGYTEEDLAAKVREKRAIGDLSKTARQKGKSATERFKAEHGKEPPEATPPRALRSAPINRQYHSTNVKDLAKLADAGEIGAIDQLDAYGKLNDGTFEEERVRRWKLRRQYPGTAGTKVE